MILSQPIRLKEDTAKIQESLLYLMGLAEGQSQYDLVKSLFLADRHHMNAYGRPVTFDNYVAMEHGPVASLAYDALKPNWSHYEARFGNEKPWQSTKDSSNPSVNRYSAKREADLEYLSPSDRAALKSANATVRSLSFTQLRRLTHEDPAYKEAWEGRRRGNKMSEDMLLPLLIEKDGENTAKRIAYISENS